jgi:serine O-acetyltransferase
MKMSITKEDLINYVAKQLNTFFPDKNEIKTNELADYIDSILERTESCFTHVNNRYFFDGKEVLFNHLHGDQYAMLLYFAANTIYRRGGNETICSKLFQLNRCLHGLDAFYEVELPDIFLFVHPLGTVLGRGKYSDYFMVYQRCGIGSNKDIYPVMKEFVTLRPGSSILGNCMVEENCTLAAGSLLIDRSLEKNTLYMGNPKSCIVKQKKEIDAIWRI